MGEEFVNVKGGKHHSVGLNRDGEVFAWGLNSYGQLAVSDADVVKQMEKEYGERIERSPERLRDQTPHLIEHGH